MGTSVLRATKHDASGHAMCFCCLWERLLRAELCSSREEVAEELVDVFNYLCAIANRLDIDLENAFRQKNKVNQGRQWT